jgi:hypothetical protein
MNIEVFSSNCFLCKETIEMVKKVIGPKCSLKTYNLVEGQGMKKAKEYSVKAVPTIVGNRQKMFEGKPEHSELLKCSREHGCKGKLLK